MHRQAPNKRAIAVFYNISCRLFIGPLHTKQAWWINFRGPELSRDGTKLYPNEMFDRHAGILINTQPLYRMKSHKSATVVPLTSTHVDNPRPFHDAFNPPLKPQHITLYENQDSKNRRGSTRSLILSDLTTTVDTGRFYKFIRNLTTDEFRRVSEGELMTIVYITFHRVFTSRITIVSYLAPRPRSDAPETGRGRWRTWT